MRATAYPNHYQQHRGAPKVPSSIPAWRQGLTPLSWVQIGSNTIYDTDPATDPAINPSYSVGSHSAPWTPTGGLNGAAAEWSGGTQWNEEVWFIGGGHAGYKGNCVWSIDLKQDAPFWARRGYPSGSYQMPIGSVESIGADNSVGSDGRPLAVHTYSLVAGTPSGIAVLPGGYQWQGSGTVTGHMFEPSSNDWLTGITFAQPSTGTGTSGCAVYDAVRDCIWYLGGSMMCRYDRSTGAKTELFTCLGTNVIGYYGRMHHDTTRDLIVLWIGTAPGGAYASNTCFFFDPNSPTGLTVAPQDTTTIRGTGGIVYSKAHDAYYAWTSGQNLVKITPPSSSPGTNTWVSSTVTGSGGTLSASSNGVFGRMQLIEKYDCITLFNLTTEKLWVLPLS